MTPWCTISCLPIQELSFLQLFINCLHLFSAALAPLDRRSLLLVTKLCFCFAFASCIPFRFVCILCETRPTATEMNIQKTLLRDNFSSCCRKWTKTKLQKSWMLLMRTFLHRVGVLKTIEGAACFTCLCCFFSVYRFLLRSAEKRHINFG